MWTIGSVEIRSRVVGISLWNVSNVTSLCGIFCGYRLRSLVCTESKTNFNAGSLELERRECDDVCTPYSARSPTGIFKLERREVYRLGHLRRRWRDQRGSSRAGTSRGWRVCPTLLPSGNFNGDSRAGTFKRDDSALHLLGRERLQRISRAGTSRAWRIDQNLRGREQLQRGSRAGMSRGDRSGEWKETQKQSKQRIGKVCNWVVSWEPLDGWHGNDANHTKIDLPQIFTLVVMRFGQEESLGVSWEQSGDFQGGEDEKSLTFTGEWGRTGWIRAHEKMLCVQIESSSFDYVVDNAPSTESSGDRSWKDGSSWAHTKVPYFVLERCLKWRERVTTEETKSSDSSKRRSSQQTNWVVLGSSFQGNDEAASVQIEWKRSIVHSISSS